MKNTATNQAFHSGKRLQKLRELQGLDILELAEEFNISFTLLEQWEAYGIPAEFIQMCCNYFEVPNSLFSEPVNNDYELEKLIESYLFSQTPANSTADKITQSLSLDLPDENLEINWLSGQSQFPCVKYERLKLINIGIYENLEINFNHDLTVLIGLNGAGKTTILKAIALATLGSEQADSETDMVVDLLRITGKSHNQAVRQAKGSIELSVNVDGEVYENRIELSYNTTTEKVDIKGERFNALFDEKGYLLNLTLGIGEQRIVSLKKPHNLGFEVTQPKVKDLLPLISNEVQACIAHFASWLANLALQAKDGSEDSQSVIKTSFDIFSALMQESIQFTDLTSIDPLELWIEQQDSQQTLPLHLYSQGYQAVMGWVGFIVQRVFEAYSELPNPLLQPAIIMIDEIDQLLHVKWQQKILNVLIESFPNIQWIITTHSPMVVTGLNQGQVIQLHQNEKGQFFAEPNSVDLWLWQYGDVVRYLFEVIPLTPEKQEQPLKEKIATLKQLPTLTFEQQQDLPRLEMQLERVQKSRAFVDKVYAEQQKLKAREQELADLIAVLSKQTSH
jgi:predicted ATP-binding protein involved in virulence